MAKFEPRESDRKLAIKKIFYNDKTVCSGCKRKFSKENAYAVVRWGPTMCKQTYIYCKKCAGSSDEVLRIVDSDIVNYGVGGIDPFLDYEKRYPDKWEDFEFNLIKDIKLSVEVENGKH